MRNVYDVTRCWHNGISQGGGVHSAGAPISTAQLKKDLTHRNFMSLQAVFRTSVSSNYSRQRQGDVDVTLSPSTVNCNYTTGTESCNHLYDPVKPFRLAYWPFLDPSPPLSLAVIILESSHLEQRRGKVSAVAARRHDAAQFITHIGLSGESEEWDL